MCSFYSARHDIYKWHADQTRQAARARSASFAGLSNPTHPAFEHIHEPGGFRRNYVLLRANENGEEPRILNNFIDFLYIFGHFVRQIVIRSCIPALIFLYRQEKTSRTMMNLRKTKRLHLTKRVQLRVPLPQQERRMSAHLCCRVKAVRVHEIATDESGDHHLADMAMRRSHKLY